MKTFLAWAPLSLMIVALSTGPVEALSELADWSTVMSLDVTMIALFLGFLLHGQKIAVERHLRGRDGAQGTGDPAAGFGDVRTMFLALGAAAMTVLAALLAAHGKDGSADSRAIIALSVAAVFTLPACLSPPAFRWQMVADQLGRLAAFLLVAFLLSGLVHAVVEWGWRAVEAVRGTDKYLLAPSGVGPVVAGFWFLLNEPRRGPHHAWSSSRRQVWTLAFASVLLAGLASYGWLAVAEHLVDETGHRWLAVLLTIWCVAMPVVVGLYVIGGEGRRPTVTWTGTVIAAVSAVLVAATWFAAIEARVFETAEPFDEMAIPLAQAMAVASAFLAIVVAPRLADRLARMMARAVR